LKANVALLSFLGKLGSVTFGTDILPIPVGQPDPRGGRLPRLAIHDPALNRPLLSGSPADRSGRQP
jgi:hypothetical protein